MANIEYDEPKLEEDRVSAALTAAAAALRIWLTEWASDMAKYETIQISVLHVRCLSKELEAVCGRTMQAWCYSTATR